MISSHPPSRAAGGAVRPPAPTTPATGRCASVRCGAMSEPTEPPSESDLLFAFVSRRYAERLTAEQLEALRRSVDDVARLTAALRAVKLDNADEPFQRFEPYRADA